MNTITVSGYFGEKQINREDFISQWYENTEIWNLVDYEAMEVMGEMKDAIKKQVEEMAGMAFDFKLKREPKERVVGDIV